MLISDRELHRPNAGGNPYHSQETIRWSHDLNRWLVFDAGLIRSIMKDKRFSVPSYELADIETRFNLDLGLSRRMSALLPLAHEGYRHVHLRQVFSRLIMGNAAKALEVFEHDLALGLQAIANRPGPSTFCLIEDLMKAPIRSMLSELSGLPIHDIPELEIIPQHFDDSISIRRRLKIESILRKIAKTDKVDEIDDETAQRIAIAIVSVNTLLSSLALSLVDTLDRFPGKALSDIPFDGSLPRTGLPLVEKVCLENVMLGDILIRKGERLRVYIESDGFDKEGHPQYSDLFFAVGPHKCLGMNPSRQAWSILTGLLGGQKMRWQVLDRKLRSMDRVFNFPESILVQVHA